MRERYDGGAFIEQRRRRCACHVAFIIFRDSIAGARAATAMLNYLRPRPLSAYLLIDGLAYQRRRKFIDAEMAASAWRSLRCFFWAQVEEHGLIFQVPAKWAKRCHAARADDDYLSASRARTVTPALKINRATPLAFFSRWAMLI